jgi:DNA-binding MarR family transcriptional regulator
MGQGNEGGGMNPTEAGCDETRPTPAEIDAVMAATRLLVAIGAQSVAKVEDRVAFPQLGVLVMIGDQGPQNLNSVAQALGVHPSNATRACDKLVEAGLLRRSDDPADRRNLILQLTESGRQLIHTMVEHWRTTIAKILAEMLAQHRSNLVPALTAFAEAAGETSPSQAWTLGWPTGDPTDTRENGREAGGIPQHAVDAQTRRFSAVPRLVSWQQTSRRRGRTVTSIDAQASIRPRSAGRTGDHKLAFWAG